jgi:hypothetical protein
MYYKLLTDKIPFSYSGDFKLFASRCKTTTPAFKPEVPCVIQNMIKYDQPSMVGE